MQQAVTAWSTLPLTLISSSRPASSQHAPFKPVPSFNAPLTTRQPRRLDAVAAAVADPPGKDGGTGVLERPGLDRSQPDGTPMLESGLGSGDISREKKTGGGNFRVLLLDDDRHTEPLVVRVLTLVVPDVDEDKAKNAFNTSRQLGQAIVTTALKEHAEFYAAQIFKQGVRATIEPDSTTI